VSGTGIEVRIEKLVLHGLGHEGRERIAASLQSELQRMLASAPPAALAHGGQIRALDAGQCGAAAGARAETIGTAVARAVYRSLG
jgi:hypothetical protein